MSKLLRRIKRHRRYTSRRSGGTGVLSAIPV
jgi:hypothetical protein